MVYVDDMYKSEIGQFGRMKMSHMIADTTEELKEMAAKIGVNLKWIQYEGTAREHFDVCLSKRTKAIQNGAKEITWRETGEFILARGKQSVGKVLQQKADDLKDEKIRAGLMMTDVTGLSESAAGAKLKNVVAEVLDKA